MTTLLAFQRPNQVFMVESTDSKGKFEFAPLEPGFAMTVGNALRRVLLSSLEGYAITSLKISGVVHEFDTIPGVIDDVQNIILNLKEVRFAHLAETEPTETVTINVSGKEVLTAKDIAANLTNFRVVNGDHVICTMDKSAKFTMELNIEKGRGYLPADENQNVSKEIGTIAMDAIFTPIVNVMYAREPERVEQKTDYDKLVMEITTDGTIHPKQALKEAAKILIQHFMLFTDEKITLDIETTPADSIEFDKEAMQVRKLLKTPLSDLDLSVRALNCLKSAELETLGDLVVIPRSELMKFRNFGKKSLGELEDKLEGLNLTFGMDVSKYKLDKE